MPVELHGRDPGCPRPAAPLLSQATCADFSLSPAAIVERLDYELSGRVYLGDAFPMVGMDAFGPGVVEAFLGARLDNSTGRVWFHPPRDIPITELSLEYDPHNVWFCRIKDICAAAMARWKGRVLVAMTDVGGNLDILAAFRPGERLLLDLYDHSEEVKRATWEAHRLWHRYFDEINAVLQPVNPGYSDWSGIYCQEPSYMLQCDFSYMISPAMFNEFARPELDATCERLAHSMYHLDGVGQLPHLDSLLGIGRLDGVQWVPGAGKPGCEHWPEVYRKIRAAGKKIQVIGESFDVLDAVVEQLGDGRGVHQWMITAPLAEESAVRRRLREYGIS